METIQLNEDLGNEYYLQKIEESGIEQGKEGILDFYLSKEVKVKDKTILLEGLGKRPKGNMLYILLELSKQAYSEFTVYFSVEGEEEEKVREFLDNNGMEQVELLRAGSNAYRRALCFAKYLVNEVDFPNIWIKKPEQVYINIWHGTPLKCLGKSKKDRTIHNEGTTQKNFLYANYLLYPNKFTMEHMIDDFCIRGLTDATAVLMGYPRTAALMGTGDVSALKSSLAENGQQIIAFMPTWRDGIDDEKQIEDIGAFLREMDAKLTGDQLMFVNLHHKVKANVDLTHFSNIKNFPEDMDIYQLLRCTDCLITDYSSVFFDFAVTRKKIILYCPDKEQYIATRGVYFDMEELPFPIVKDVDSLITELNGPKTYNDKSFIKTFCCYDRADNTERFCRAFFLGDTGSLKRKKIKGNGRKNYLIYSEALKDDEGTRLLYEFSNMNKKNNYNIYLSFKNSLVNENLDSAYPLLKNVNILGTKGKLLLTKSQKIVHKIYEEGTLSFEDTVPYLMSAYKTEQKRKYANAVFEAVLIFGTKDIDTIVGFCYFDCKRYLGITEDMLLDIKRGNDDLKKSILFFYSTGNGIFVISETARKLTEEILPEELSDSISLVDSAERLDVFIKDISRK